jgi:DNA-binding MarR family transcriptional regulator
MRLKKQDYETLAEFRYQWRRFERVSEKIVRQEGITVQQYVLLLQLKGYPGREWATIVELAERLQAHHHSVVGLVDRCAERGLVRRQPSTRSRREVEVHLTAAGELCLEHLAKMHRAALAAQRNVFKVPIIEEEVEPGSEGDF